MEGNLAFEKAPFKLPLEMVEVMGGIDSNFFMYFRSLVRAGFVALRKGYRRILAATRLMIHAGKDTWRTNLTRKGVA